jgi:hypothetical protein
VVLYFEEIQWLANYQDDFLAQLKPFWDDIYRKIIDLLANRKFADQKGIYRTVVPGKINSQKGHPGGSFTLLLDELESLGFISKYLPIDTRQNITGLARYCISDEYLHFYLLILSFNSSIPKFLNPSIWCK